MTVFTAAPSGTQSLTASTDNEIVFATEVFDPSGVFASNRFTVAASDNGKYAVLWAGIRIASSGSHSLFIERSTDSGSTWTKLGGSTGVNSTTQVSTGVVLLATGDIYRVVCNPASSVSTTSTDRIFFSGQTLGITSEIFRAEPATAQTMPSNSLTEVAFGTEIVDTASVFASNRVNIPASENGKYGCFVASLELDAALSSDAVYWQKSTDSGSTWTIIAQWETTDDASGSHRMIVRSPLVLCATGDLYRVAYFGDPEDVVTTGTSYVSGYIFSDA